MFGTITENYLTPAQAARVLSVNRQTVRRWVMAGRMRGERVGNITLVWREDVERERADRALTAQVEQDDADGE